MYKGAFIYNCYMYRLYVNVSFLLLVSNCVMRHWLGTFHLRFISMYILCHCGYINVNVHVLISLHCHSYSIVICGIFAAVMMFIRWSSVLDCLWMSMIFSCVYLYLHISTYRLLFVFNFAIITDLTLLTLKNAWSYPVTLLCCHLLVLIIMTCYELLCVYCHSLVPACSGFCILTLSGWVYCILNTSFHRLITSGGLVFLCSICN